LWNYHGKKWMTKLPWKLAFGMKWCWYMAAMLVGRTIEANEVMFIEPRWPPCICNPYFFDLIWTTIALNYIFSKFSSTFLSSKFLCHIYVNAREQLYPQALFNLRHCTKKINKDVNNSSFSTPYLVKRWRYLDIESFLFKAVW
jgi:hypothetical protein